MPAIIYDDIFDLPFKQFLEHVGKECNDRVLFSARYGMGKTSFLKYHFSQEVMASSYDVYHIFPVNYVVGSNEDIIRYIKYDLVFQMLEKNIAINETTRSYLKNLPAFVKKNLDKVACALVRMVPKIGRDMVDSYERLKALVQEFVSQSRLKGDQLVDSLDQMEAMDGGLFDNDVITNIIINVLHENKDRKSVLIVDDLDRLDPEHVFRIMNVFAAHFDTPGAASSKGDPEKAGMKNKFGFDKVILVCDFVNIERLFFHRYGPEVDFYGYADKFYSSDVFHFDNKLAINSIIRNCLQTGVRNEMLNEKEYAVYMKMLLGDDFLESFLQLLVNFSLINLRNIIKLHAITVQKNQELTLGRKKLELEGLPVILQLKMLRDVVGDVRRLLSIFERCENLQPPVNYVDHAFAVFLLIIKLHQNGSADDKGDKTVFFNGKPFFIEYNLWESPVTSTIFDVQKNAPGKVVKGGAYKASPKDFWLAIYKATEVLKEIGYLQ